MRRCWLGCDDIADHVDDKIEAKVAHPRHDEVSPVAVFVG
jgi:hypothetical protein